MPKLCFALCYMLVSKTKDFLGKNYNASCVNFLSNFFWFYSSEKSLEGWMDGWMDGWMEKKV